LELTGKVNVCAVSDVGDADWGNFHDEEGEDPYVVRIIFIKR
jgi:hypothetical protein